jgi:hypothetical protein
MTASQGDRDSVFVSSHLSSWLLSNYAAKLSASLMDLYILSELHPSRVVHPSVYHQRRFELDTMSVVDRNVE